MADGDIPVEMAWQACDFGDDDEYWGVLPRQLDQLCLFLRWWRCFLALSHCLPVCLSFHTMGYNSVAPRISSVSPSHPPSRCMELSLTIFRWLLARGRDEEAREVIGCLEAKPTNDPVVVAQCNEINYSVCYERENSVRWRDLWKQRNNGTKTIRRLLLGAGTQFMQQFEGISIMSYFLPTVLMNVSLQGSQTYIVAVQWLTVPFPNMSVFRDKWLSFCQRVTLFPTCSSLGLPSCLLKEWVAGV